MNTPFERPPSSQSEATSDYKESLDDDLSLEITAEELSNFRLGWAFLEAQERHLATVDLDDIGEFHRATELKQTAHSDDPDHILGSIPEQDSETARLYLVAAAHKVLAKQVGADPEGTESGTAVVRGREAREFLLYRDQELAQELSGRLAEQKDPHETGIFDVTGQEDPQLVADYLHQYWDELSPDARDALETSLRIKMHKDHLGLA